MSGRSDFSVGATIIAAIAVVVAAGLWLGDLGPRGPKSLHTARFRTVGGVKVGDPVVLRGVKVGRVEAIRLAADETRLHGGTETLGEELEIRRKAFHGLLDRQDFLLVRHSRPDSYIILKSVIHDGGASRDYRKSG